MSSKHLWPLKQAKLILKNIKSDQTDVVFETGYGPSGLPHFGTFAEVVRTIFIIKSLNEIAPKLNPKLIVFSDDRDGLRKLPPNIPNHNLLKNELGKPLSLIADPFGEKESFASFMNEKLVSFLDQFNFKYDFISSTNYYLSGKLDHILLLVADNYETIRQILISTISKDKRANWSPFMVICPNCNRIYTTKISHVDTKNYSINFECCINDNSYNACGYSDKVDINGKLVKLGWKVDWAARWAALNVDFEAHGEDLTESVRVSKKLCKFFNTKAPITYKYELFLDEFGNKISKTKGNGLSMDQWLKYSPLSALLYFLTFDPNKSRKMGITILPKLVDDYYSAEKKLQNELLTLNDQLWYVRQIIKDRPDNIENFLSFRLVANVIESTATTQLTVLLDYITKYNQDLVTNNDFIEICEKSILFVQETQLNNNQSDIIIDKTLIDLLYIWRDYLISVDNGDALVEKQTQKKIFEIATTSNVEIKKWFKFLYNVYLNKNEGPKLGNYFSLLGKHKTLELTNNAIKKIKDE